MNKIMLILYIICIKSCRELERPEYKARSTMPPLSNHHIQIWDWAGNIWKIIEPVTFQYQWESIVLEVRICNSPIWMYSLNFVICSNITSSIEWIKPVHRNRKYGVQGGQYKLKQQQSLRSTFPNHASSYLQVPEIDTYGSPEAPRYRIWSIYRQFSQPLNLIFGTKFN